MSSLLLQLNRRYLPPLDGILSGASKPLKAETEGARKRRKERRIGQKVTHEENIPSEYAVTFQNSLTRTRNANGSPNQLHVLLN
jgi:hypothetical protein